MPYLKKKMYHLHLKSSQHTTELIKDYGVHLKKEKITKDVLLDTRFGLLFDAFNREVDSVKMGENYREYLSQGHDLLGNSQRILEKLAPHYDLYIVTNGVAKHSIVGWKIRN